MKNTQDIQGSGNVPVRTLPIQGYVDTHPDTSPPTIDDLQEVSVGSAPTQVISDTPDSKPPGRSASTPEAASRSSAVGQIGRFTYVRMLGKGAFGTVWQVWDPELQTHRAIKIPHRELIASGKVDAESYVREARKVTQLGKHRGIVEVLDVQRLEDGTPYVVSEFISGGSLADSVSGRRVPWREAVELLAKIADGIAHAHSKGIVHRDLKPANILLTDEGEPVVADFGLALADGEFSYKSTVCGTYHYMSPQQVRGEADRVDGRSDVYSLGVMLYQLLTGRIPYKSQNIDSLKREILSEQPTPLRQYTPDVPPEVEAICEKALAKEPNDRYRTAADMAKALRATTQTQPAAASGPLSHGAKPPNRWLPVGIAAAGFAAVAVGVFAFMGRSGQLDPVPIIPPPPPPNATIPPDLAIHFKEAGSSGEFHRTLKGADLPMVVRENDNGDRFQLHVQLAEPMYAYIYWIDTEGDVTRIWPEKNADLDQQAKFQNLSSPSGAKATATNDEQPWWSLPVTGKPGMRPVMFFVGVSPKPLDSTQLSDFETVVTFNRDLRDGDLWAEFEFPERPETYVYRDGRRLRGRGSELVLVSDTKIYASDHSDLQKWFSAYHGWIVATEE